MRVGLRVPHDPASAALVRHEVADDLAAHGVSAGAAADVILVTSELVGNAVVHTPDTADVDVDWDIGDDTVTVRVADASAARPRPRRSSVTATGGRGLAIVAAIATDWGTHETATGKQVWARIPITRDV